MKLARGARTAIFPGAVRMPNTPGFAGLAKTGGRCRLNGVRQAHYSAFRGLLALKRGYCNKSRITSTQQPSSSTAAMPQPSHIAQVVDAWGIVAVGGTSARI